MHVITLSARVVLEKKGIVPEYKEQGMAKGNRRPKTMEDQRQWKTQTRTRVYCMKSSIVTQEEECCNLKEGQKVVKKD